MAEPGEARPREIALEETLVGADAAPTPAVGIVTPRPTTRGDTPLPAASEERLAAERQREIDQQEQVNHLLRFRTFMPFIIVMWSAFGIVDWMVARFIAHGPVTPFLLLRGGFACFLVLVTWRTHRKPLPSPREFHALELCSFLTVCVVITSMGFFYGGIVTPYFAGIILALLVRSVIVAERWQVGLRNFGMMALTYPAVFAAAAPFSPEIRAQFTDPGSLATFAHNLGFVLGGLAVIVIGGHVTWTLRRQVFETRSIGRYRLRRCIGRGGMGEVWAAHDMTLKRDVALKILRPERVNDEWLQRFQREARATADLSHIHTIRIFDYGASDDGIWYYAMELLDGETLRQRVMRDGPLPPELVHKFAIDIAGALAEAHGRGIVHRDLKPENLFIAQIGGEHDVIKLLDFGLAKVDTEEDGLTRSGWIGGTPTYMSPEVAAGHPADARSDLYSLGASLYFALTGEPPFAGTTLGSLLKAHMTQAARPPSALVPDVPPDLDRLILRCLDKDPAARPRDGAELLALLTTPSPAPPRRSPAGRI